MNNYKFWMPNGAGCKNGRKMHGDAYIKFEDGSGVGFTNGNGFGYGNASNNENDNGSGFGYGETGITIGNIEVDGNGVGDWGSIII